MRNTLTGCLLSLSAASARLQIGYTYGGAASKRLLFYLALHFISLLAWDGWTIHRLHLLEWVHELLPLQIGHFLETIGGCLLSLLLFSTVKILICSRALLDITVDQFLLSRLCCRCGWDLEIFGHAWCILCGCFLWQRGRSSSLLRHVIR